MTRIRYLVSRCWKVATPVLVFLCVVMSVLLVVLGPGGGTGDVSTSPLAQTAAWLSGYQYRQAITIPGTALGMSQSISGGINVTPTANYFAPLMGLGTWNATEGNVTQIVSAPGKLDTFHVTVATAPGSSTSVIYTVVVNGTPSALTVTIANTATSGTDDAHQLSITAGDVVSVKCTVSGSPTLSQVRWACRFYSDVQKSSLLMSHDYHSANNTLYYGPITGWKGTSSASALSCPMPTPGSIRNLRIKIVTGAPGTGKGFIVTLYVNGAASTLTCTATGTLGGGSDTTHVVSLNAGDLVYWGVAGTGTPTAACNIAIGAEFVPNTNGESCVFGGSAGSGTSTSVVSYLGVQTADSSSAGWNTTETTMYQQSLACTIKNLYAVATTPGTSPRSVTLTFRNGNPIGDSTLTVTITAASLTPNDVTHSVSVASDDIVTMKATPSTTVPNTLTPRWGLVCYMPSASSRTDWPVQFDVYKGTPTYEYNSSGWAINSKTYHWRIPYPVETYSTTTEGYQVKVTVDTATLCSDTLNGSSASRFFAGTTATYAESVEFANPAGTTCYYWVETSAGIPMGFPSKTTSGSHSGANNAAVLTDSTASWTTNALVGLVVYNQTDGSSATITANTATTVTGTLSGGTQNDWDTLEAYYIPAGTTYWVRMPALTAGTKYPYYMYCDYAQTGVSTNFSGANTFDYFNDFTTAFTSWAEFIAAYPEWEICSSKVIGTDGNDYNCILANTGAALNCPTTGANYTTYWVSAGTTGQGDVWAVGASYTVGAAPTVSRQSSHYLRFGGALYSGMRMKWAPSTYFTFKARIMAESTANANSFIGMGDNAMADGWWLQRSDSTHHLTYRIGGVGTSVNQATPTMPFNLELDLTAGPASGGLALAFYNDIMKRLPTGSGLYYKGGIAQTPAQYKPYFLVGNASRTTDIDWIAVGRQCLQAPVHDTNSSYIPIMTDGCRAQFPDITLEQAGRIFLNGNYNAPSKVIGTDGSDYYCIQDNTGGASTNKPTTGSVWTQYWTSAGTVGEGATWLNGASYLAGSGVQSSDIVFTASDGITQLYAYPDSMSQRSSLGRLVHFTVKIPTIPIPEGTTIYVYYGGPASSSTYKVSDSVFTLGNDDFDATSPLTWNALSGTWANVAQARGIYGGGPQRWCRNPGVFKIGSTYYLLYDGEYYPGTTAEWGNPFTFSVATSTDAVHWTYKQDYWWDYSTWSYYSSGSLDNPAVAAAYWRDDSDGTIYIAVTAPGGADSTGNESIVTTTDLVNFTPFANTPMFIGDVDDPLVAASGSNYMMGGTMLKHGGKWWIFYSIIRPASSPTSCLRASWSDTGLSGSWSANCRTIYNLHGTETYTEHPTMTYDSSTSRWYLIYDCTLNSTEQGYNYSWVADADFDTGLAAGDFTDLGRVVLPTYDLMYGTAMSVLAPDKIDGKWYLWMGCFGEYDNGGNPGQDNPAMYATNTDLSDSDGWVAGDGSVHYEYEQQTVDANTYTSLIAGGKTFTDCEINTEFGLHSGRYSVIGASSCGLLFDYTDANNYYYLWVWRNGTTTSNGFYLTKTVSGSPTTLGSIVCDNYARDLNYSDISLGQTYLFDLKLYGTSITAKISVDGGESWKTVYSGTSSRLGNQVGFRSTANAAFFNGIHVMQCDTTALVPGIPGTEQKSVPVVDSISPAYGYKGESGKTVTLTGSNFTDTLAVNFSNPGVSTDDFTVDLDTQITAHVSITSSADLGLCDVSASSQWGTGNKTNAFTVKGPSSCDPTSGNRGETNKTVTIGGTGFTGATNVSFSGTGVTLHGSPGFTVDTDSQITAYVDITWDAEASTRDISITVPTCTTTGSSLFTVGYPTPVVSYCTPDNGNVSASNLQVTITGTGFIDASAVSYSGTGISLHGSPGYAVDSSTQITSYIDITGSAPAGAGNVSVTTPGGMGTGTNVFTVNVNLVITNNSATGNSYDFGSVFPGGIESTGLSYFTVTNSSNSAVNITISGTDMTGSGYTWTLSDTATPGPSIFGMNSGLLGGSYTIVVRKNATYNILKSGLAISGTQDWGLQFLAPTGIPNSAVFSGTVTITATQA